MAFLCTFSGLLAAGAIWMLLFVEFGDATTPALNSIAAWLSPMAVGGWCFYVVLSVACSWLAYRLLRSRLGGDAPLGPSE
jgi:hypothetical protein